MSVLTPTEGLIAVSKESVSSGAVKALGFIVYWFIPDEEVKLTDLRESWLSAGLDPAPLPKSVREVDQFRRAVRAEAGRRDSDDGLVVETDVRDIPTNDDWVTYQVSRVVKDITNVVVDYPRALKVKYNRRDGMIEFDKLAEGTDDMIESIKARFESNQKTVTGNRVRALIRDFLTNDADKAAGLVGLSAESMRPSGGVYFVLARFGDQVEALGRFVDTLYDGGSAAVCSVPMADGSSEREMVRRAHVANSVAEINKAIADGRELMREDRQRPVTDNIRQHHFDRMQRLKRHAADYAKALEDEQEELTSHLALLGRQLNKLVAA